MAKKQIYILDQSLSPLQDMQHELEQLTKELRQVNLQQFIQQTGTKVTVLPAEPSEDEEGTTHTGQGTGNLLQMSQMRRSSVWVQPLALL